MSLGTNQIIHQNEAFIGQGTNHSKLSCFPNFVVITYYLVGLANDPHGRGPCSSQLFVFILPLHSLNIQINHLCGIVLFVFYR